MSRFRVGAYAIGLAIGLGELVFSGANLYLYGDTHGLSVTRAVSITGISTSGLGYELGYERGKNSNNPLVDPKMDYTDEIDIDGLGTKEEWLELLEEPESNLQSLGYGKHVKHVDPREEKEWWEQ